MFIFSKKNSRQLKYDKYRHTKQATTSKRNKKLLKQHARSKKTSNSKRKKNNSLRSSRINDRINSKQSMHQSVISRFKRTRSLTQSKKEITPTQHLSDTLSLNNAKNHKLSTKVNDVNLLASNPSLRPNTQKKLKCK